MKEALQGQRPSEVRGPGTSARLTPRTSLPMQLEAWKSAWVLPPQAV